MRHLTAISKSRELPSEATTFVLAKLIFDAIIAVRIFRKF